jgi:hypothetical protein
MKTVVEAYASIWAILLLVWIAIAFTTINLNVSQARKTYNDIKAELQACNGNLSIFQANHGGTVNADGSYTSHEYTGNGYTFSFNVEYADTNANYTATNQTYIYNDLYRLNMTYTYGVPLFGTFTYPQVGYVY